MKKSNKPCDQVTAIEPKPSLHVSGPMAKKLQCKPGEVMSAKVKLKSTGYSISNYDGKDHHSANFEVEDMDMDGAPMMEKPEEEGGKPHIQNMIENGLKKKAKK